MDIQTWLAFVSASSVLRVIPGPAILRVASYGPGRGWRAALPTAVGVALGDFTAMALSMPGIGVLLTASATLFTLLKLAGAAYLIWLGVQLWRSGGAVRAQAKTERAAMGRMIGPAWPVMALDRKSLAFVVALLL